MSHQQQIQLEENDILLVKSIAGKIVRSIGFTGHLEDLIQEGYIALLSVKGKYTERPDCTFATYASHRIKGAMQDFLRKQDYLSREARKLLKDVNKARTQLEHRENKKPSIQAISNEMKVDMERLLSALSVIPDQIISGSEFDFEVTSDLSEITINHELNDSELHLAQQQIKNKMSILDEREKQVMIGKYWNEESYRNIASNLKISSTMCIELHNRSILKMRKVFAI